MDDPAPAPALHRSRFWPLWLLLALCILPEAALSLADAGLVGSPRWRMIAVQNLGFWPGLLHDWRANYAGQPAAMFLTYMFIHAGPAHLIGNMAAFIWLALGLDGRLRPLALLGLWLGAGIAGGALFGLMATGSNPAVGASGAIFGLFGFWLAGEMQRLRKMVLAGGEERRTALLWGLKAAAVFGAVLLYGHLAQGRPTAWQAHLGGFLFGFPAGLAARAGRQTLEKIRS